MCSSVQIIFSYAVVGTVLYICFWLIVCNCFMHYIYKVIPTCIKKVSKESNGAGRSNILCDSMWWSHSETSGRQTFPIPRYAEKKVTASLCLTMLIVALSIHNMASRWFIPVSSPGLNWHCLNRGLCRNQHYCADVITVRKLSLSILPLHHQSLTTVFHFPQTCPRSYVWNEE